jgi:Skp family chaperone for outer membrane proteins
MVRMSVLAAGAAVVVGAAFVTGTSVPPRSLPDTAKPEEARFVFVTQKTGYFNMAAVIREYKRAKTAVQRLNERRDRMSGNIRGLRAMHSELKVWHDAEQKKLVSDRDVKRMHRISGELLLLSRQIEDREGEMNRLLNDQATIIISELYDEIHAVAVEMAREHGLVALLAYPDAVTEEEWASPQVKELKLKPPAAQPFYLDPSVDYTAEIHERLNNKFVEDGD